MDMHFFFIDESLDAEISDRQVRCDVSMRISNEGRLLKNFPLMLISCNPSVSTKRSGILMNASTRKTAGNPNFTSAPIAPFAVIGTTMPPACQREPLQVTGHLTQTKDFFDGRHRQLYQRIFH
jgi:hypothetical protein